MHENAINNTALTPTQRSSHLLAATSLVPLYLIALEASVTHPDLWGMSFPFFVHNVSYLNATQRR